MKKETSNILTLENREKFRRKLLVISRIIGVFLILSIFWVGFIQIKYVSQINSIKAEYGEYAYCYLCGLEQLRKCDCYYYKTMDYGNIRMPLPDLEGIGKELAEYNTKKCIPFDSFIEQKVSEINLTK